MAKGQDILIMEEVDVRRTDDPDDSRVLTITKFGLPKPVRKKADHTPGGGVGTVAFLMPMLDAFEPTFSVKGIDIDTLNKFGFAAGAHDTWTFAGTIRNKTTNRLMSFRCFICGIVADWSPGDHTPGELIDCDHTLAEVTKVQYELDGVELFHWDFYARIFNPGTGDIFAEYRNALGA